MNSFTDKQKKEFVEYFNELLKLNIKPSLEHFQKRFGLNNQQIAYDALVTARFHHNWQSCGDLVSLIRKYNQRGGNA